MLFLSALKKHEIGKIELCTQSGFCKAIKHNVSWKTSADHCAFQTLALTDLIKERKNKVQKGYDLKIIYYRVSVLV